jgi:hypothetical protein
MESLSQYLVPLIILIAVAALLTFFVFKKRAVGHGLEKGTAANPQQVKRENPPDPKSTSVNRQGV